MSILLFVAFFATAFYVVRNGVGREKALFLVPLAAWILLGILHAAIFVDEATLVAVAADYGLAAVLLGLCAWTVQSVRKNSMDRIMRSFGPGAAEPGREPAA